MHEIVRLRRADEDLIAIWRFIAGFDPAAADRVLDSLERRWVTPAAHPLSALPREGLAPGLRQLVSGEYLTLYRVTEDTVEIIRVPHGRRKIEDEVFTTSEA